MVVFVGTYTIAEDYELASGHLADVFDMRIPVLITLFSVIVTSVYAQTSEYSTSKGERWGYAEITRSTVELTTPQGPMEVSSLHDAEIDVVFTAQDTARAFYTSLALGMESPQGTLTPETAPIIGKPFVLHFTSKGQVETVSTPTFPESFQGVTDLSRQFLDFFTPLPDHVLEQGVSWTDTLRVSGDDNELIEKIGRYEVMGDTLIGGIPAKIISTKTSSVIESSAPGPAPDITIISKLAGVESGFVYFAPEQGVLLRRTRTGLLEGEVKYEGTPQPIVLPQQLRYESTISAIDP